MNRECDQREDTCVSCHGTRHRKVYFNGRYTVGLPHDCPHKDTCERAILLPYRIDERRTQAERQRDRQNGDGPRT